MSLNCTATLPSSTLPSSTWRPMVPLQPKGRGAAEQRELLPTPFNWRYSRVIYIQSMQEFERGVFSTYGNHDLLLRDAVGLDLGPNPKPLGAKLARQHYLLCNTISSYRLVEELGQLSNTPPMMAAPRSSRQISDVTIELSTFNSYDTKHLDTLKDIASLVNNFCQAVDGMSNFRLTGQGGAGPLAHLATLFQLKKATDFAKILTNLTVAALHLGYVLETPFHGKLPDLPDSLDDYLATLPGLSGDSSMLQKFPDEVNFLRSLYFGATEKEKPNIRSTLQVVLMISPLTILAPKKRWSRKNMHEFAASLGNVRPPELVKVERLVFKTIYDVARRGTDVVTAALQLCKALSMVVHNGELFANNVRYWFDLGKHALANLKLNFSSATIAEMDNTRLTVVAHPTSMDGDSNQEQFPESITTEAFSEATARTSENPHGQEPPNSHNKSLVDEYGTSSDNDSDLSDLETIEIEYRQGIVGLTHSTQRSMDNSDISDSDTEDEDTEDEGAGTVVAVNENEDGEDEVDEDEDEDGDDVMEDDAEDPTLPQASRKKVGLGSLVPNQNLRKRRRAADEKAENGKKPGNRHPGRLRYPKLDVALKATRPAKRRKVVEGQPVLNDTPSEGAPPSNDVPLELIIIDYDTEEEAEVAEVEENTLELDPTPSILHSKNEYSLYGPTESSLLSFSPISHRNVDLRCQEEFLQAVLDSYVDDKPLHLVNPEKSAFYSLTAAEFEKKSVHEIQNIFAHQNIVVYDLPQKGLVEFDEAGFYTLVPSLDEKIDVQDQSINTKGNYNSRLRRGTARQILAAHRQNGGKILNALNFPGTHLAYPDLPLSSDLVAWEATRSRKMSRDEDFPTRNMRWFLAATKGATHMWHIDSDGAGTIIGADNGSKCWIVAYPKEGHSEESFASIDFFLPPFDITKACKAKWTLEAIVLSPGSRLALLRRMAELCYLVLVRNKQNDNPRTLVHVPSLDNMDGVLNLLSLCNLVIFANVLDNRTYLDWQKNPNLSRNHTKKYEAYDRNALSVEEREKYRHARGMCFQILFWFAASFEVTAKGSSGEIIQIDNILEHLIFAYLVQQGRALLIYKEKADRVKISGFPGCTLEKLNAQLDAVFALNDKLKESWKSSAGDPETKYCNLLWSGCKDLIFKRKDAASISRDFKVVDFSASGTTALDSRFFKGYTTGFEGL
ncbi:hypothetical protein BJ912DRAFT_925766 [Pholiota molesta]|nr:hypothetical protein BJ912DRAFT_925766 [Pholiota molesta]